MILRLSVLGRELVRIEIERPDDQPPAEPGPPFGFSASGGGQIELSVTEMGHLVRGLQQHKRKTGNWPLS